jgi:hypothetical protein
VSTEPLKASDAISVRELADMRSAGKALTVLDVREARELDICLLEGALHVPMAEIPARTDDLPTNQLLVVICHHGARSQMVVDFSEAPTSTAALMLGLARLTNRCSATDSVHPERDFGPCR